MNNCAIHNNSAHANQHIVVHGAAMHNGIVPYRNVVAQHRLRPQVRAVNNSAILHIYLIAHPDSIYIAAYYGAKPHAALVAHLYIANNSSVRRNKTILAPGRVLSFYW